MFDKQVTRAELANLKTPMPTRSWMPVSHYDIANETINALQQVNYEILSERWTLSRADQRIFGVIDLRLPIAEAGKGVNVAIGVRSGYDKTLPFGIVAGSRVYVCSNLSFSGEISYKRKHTINGFDDFLRNLEQSIIRLQDYAAYEAARIQKWMNFELKTEQADALLLALFESQTLSVRHFKGIMEEYRNPSYHEFAGRITLWNFFNRITTALKTRSTERPLSHSCETSQLIHQLDKVIDVTANLKNDLIRPLAIEFAG